MRLTHVGYLRLPFGPLLSFDLSVEPAPSEPGQSLPVSFDQRRHVGMGDRQGSWMALSFRLPHPTPRDHLAAAWRAVVAAHGTLHTVFVPGPDGPGLFTAALGAGRWTEHEVAPGQAMNDAVRGVLDAGCSPYARPSHRLCVVETADGPTLVVAADHAHVDLWSMLVIARDLLAALAQCARGETPTPACVPAFAEHTLALQNRPRAPEEIHRRWAEILESGGGVMPRFPLPLGEPGPQPERVEVRDVLDLAGLAAYSSRAAGQSVSALALTVSAMTETTRVLAGADLRVVFPVHSRSEERWHDSVGWFITNAVLESSDPDPVACAAAVREAIRLGSWPLAGIMAPYGGMPEAPGMVAVSWVDLRRLPVQIDAVGLDAQYVSAAVQTNGVMLWFVLDDSGAHLRCRYPDTVQARRNVGAWLDDLVARIRVCARR